MDRRTRRAVTGRTHRLARKGEILYGKSCGTGGRGTCTESFAVHQLRLGHVEVARDLLRFLRRPDRRASDGRIPTDSCRRPRRWPHRIRRHLEDEPRSAHDGCLR